MNQFYVLTEKNCNGRESESIVTQELLDSLTPLPATTTVCKFVSDAYHQTTMKQMVDEVQNRLLHIMTQHQQTTDLWHKEQANNAELRKRVAELQVEAEQADDAEADNNRLHKRIEELEKSLIHWQLAMGAKKQVWRLDVAPFQQGTYTLYFDSAELMKEYCEKLLKADAMIRGPDTEHMALHTRGWEIKILSEIKE